LEFRQEFRFVVYVGKTIYCYWPEKTSLTGTDYDKLAAELEAEIVSSTSLPQYYRILTQWAAAFQDGHVNANVGEKFNETERFTLPIKLGMVGAGSGHEKIFVTQTVGNVEGLLVGDEIFGINNKPIPQIVREIGAKRSGSTVRMRHRNTLSAITTVYGSDMAGERLEFSVRRDGRAWTVPMFRISDVRPDVEEDEGAEPTDEEAIDSVTAIILSGNIGYLRLDTFSAPMLTKVISDAMDRLVNTRGLIIDVRFNGGGSLSPGDEVLSRLTASEITRYEVSEKLGEFMAHARPSTFFLDKLPEDPSFAAWHPNSVKPKPEKNYLNKPVVVLTGPYCFSACDTFVAAIKSHKLATIIGEGTAGGTGTPLSFTLPNSELKFRYSVVRGRTVQGLPIEGEGTIPDIYIERDKDSLLGKRDNQVKAAYDHIVRSLQLPLIPNNLAMAETQVVKAAKPVRYDVEVEVWDDELPGSDTD
jgi:C-terminal processing protease CtpA/Prc